MFKKPKPKNGNRPPISKHPLFPAVVALWFGALFGLGSLAIRVTLIESVLLSASVDTWLPSAAPPLGLKARILLALAMAVIGCLIGAYLARRLATDKVVPRERQRSPGAADGRRENSPGLAADADQRVEQIAVPTERRRPLTVEDTERLLVPHEFAPLPGSGPQIFQVSDLAIDDDCPMFEPEAAPLDLGDIPQRQTFSPEQPTRHDDSFLAPIDLDSLLGEKPAPVAAQQRFDAPAAFSVPEEMMADQAEQRPFGQRPDAEAFEPIVTIAPVPQAFEPEAYQPAPVAAPVPQAFEPVVYQPASVTSPAVPQAFEPATYQPELVAEPVAPPAALVQPEPVLPTAFVPQTPAPVFQEAPFQEAPPMVQTLSTSEQRIASADVATLSPVELVERLALAMRRRGTDAAVLQHVQAPAPLEQQPVAQTQFQQPPVQQAPPVLAAAAIPAALRPISLDIGEDDLAETLPHVPIRHIAMPSPQATTTATAPAEVPKSVFELAGEPKSFKERMAAVSEVVSASAAEADVVEENYPSLLDIGRTAPQRQNSLRIDEEAAEEAAPEPVVIFPGQAARPSAMFQAPPQAAVAASNPFAASQAAAEPEELPEVTPLSSLRRFDGPGSTGIASPALHDQNVQQLSPDETQQALRAALATLQRMGNA